MKYTLAFSSRRRTLGIQVRGGEVIVRAPKGLDRQQIEDFVQSRKQWIEQHQRKQKQALEEQSVVIAQSGRVPWQGEWLELSWSRASRSRVLPIRDQRIHVQLSSRVRRAEDEVVRELLQNWYQNQAEFILLARLREFAERTGLQPSRAYIGHWRARWGQCSARGEIGLNWRLLQLPAAMQGYVILHELCHLRHMNHGPEFHRLLTQHLPDQRQVSKQISYYSAWLNW